MKEIFNLGAKTMAVELLKEETVKGIPACEMKDGEIGVVVAWKPDEYIGRIVQRHEDELISIGKAYRYRWNAIDRLPSACRVRVLEKGEKLVIT